MKMFFSTRHKRIFSPCQKQTLQSELLRNPSPNTSLVSINIKNIFSSASSAAHFTRNASDLLHAQSKTFFFFPVYVPVALTDVTPLFVSSAIFAATSSPFSVTTKASVPAPSPYNTLSITTTDANVETNP